MTCEQCRWETEMRKFHGRSVRVLKGQGHDACSGGGCTCSHALPSAEEIPGVARYANLFQEAVYGSEEGDQ